MKLITKRLQQALLRNGQLRNDWMGTDAEPDFLPVLKLFTPDGACTWLLVSLDPDDPDLAYGLCDLGAGFPELGQVRISELENVRGRLGLPIERDSWFSPTKTLSA